MYKDLGNIENFNKDLSNKDINKNEFNYNLYSEYQERSALLLGLKNLNKLSKTKIAVIGLGGVGGFCVEGLARSHVGNLMIIDKDIVSPSNLNRQIIATVNSLGQKKTDLIEERILSINPKLNVEKIDCFIKRDSDLTFLSSVDYVIDCIDSVSGKINIALFCHRHNIPLIMCTGTARKLDPSRIEIIDLFKSKNDKLCKVLRRELKKEGIKSQDILFSSEIASGVSPNNFPNEKRLGSLIFVPAVAGLTLANFVINKLTSPYTEEDQEKDLNYLITKGI